MMKIFTEPTFPLGTCLVGLSLALASCRTPHKMQVSAPVTLETKVSADPLPYKFVRRSGPELLEFEELVQLSEKPIPEGELKERFDRLLSTPFIDNSAYFEKGMPALRSDDRLGPALRVSTWNVEKSVRIPEVAEALLSEDVFAGMMRSEVRELDAARVESLRQRAALAASDVFLLQEQDIGHCRSGYIFAAEHLAKKLGMNFVYAPQQLEVDPVYLGLDHVKLENDVVDHAACKALAGAEATYRGVFGVSVLSRYPIKRAQIFQLETQVYDWYTEEAKKGDFIEGSRKLASRVAFKFRPVRELKVGGRGFVRVDLHVPGLPHETLSIINIHLEIKTTPKQRKLQLEEILGHIAGIKNPVVMTGDYNSAPTDVSPTSFLRVTKRTASDPKSLLAAGLLVADVTGANQIRGVLNAFKNYRDPLAWSVPVILPNKVRPLFDLVEDFRFEDGGAFDFRGDVLRSGGPGCKRKLANSNQRHPNKGFTFTFAVPRPIGPIGRQRLDWMFVKSLLSDPLDKEGPYRLAPHFGQTLGMMNLAVDEPFSDHHPITVLLPLEEPDITKE